MKWEYLENKIKTALYGHKSVVDVDELWAAIESEVDAINRKKKRRGFIWFWVLGTLIAGAGIGYYFFQKNSHILPEKLQIEEYVKQENIENKNEDKKIASLPENKDASIEKLANELVNANVSTVGQENSIASKPRSTSNTIHHDLPKVKGNITSKSVAQAQSKKNEINAVDNAATKETLTGRTPVNQKNNTPSTLELGEKVQEITAIPTLALNFFDLPLADISVKNSIINEPSLLPSKRRKDWSAAMNVQSSISFVQRDLALKNSLSFNLLNSRKKSERELEAYQVGMGFTLQHRSGLNFSTGLNYTQINERFRFNEVAIKVDTVYDVKYLVINLNNDTVKIYGDVTNETKTTYQKEYYNKYRMFDVPILVGYRHEGHDFSFGAQAGVFVNLSLATKGQFLKSTTETMDIGTAGIFKSNIGWSYYFGLTAGYMVNENLEFYASPFLRHYPKDFTKDSYVIRQRYNLYGLNIGLRYAF